MDEWSLRESERIARKRGAIRDGALLFWNRFVSAARRLARAPDLEDQFEFQDSLASASFQVLKLDGMGAVQNLVCEFIRSPMVCEIVVTLPSGPTPTENRCCFDAQESADRTRWDVFLEVHGQRLNPDKAADEIVGRFIEQFQ